MTTLEALKAARALIEDPKRWTQHEFARDADGKRVAECDEAAVCWCLFGAAYRVASPREHLWHAVAVLTGRACASGAKVNDGQTRLADGSTGHPAVLKIYDKAIELAAAEAEASRE